MKITLMLILSCMTSCMAQQLAQQTCDASRRTVDVQTNGAGAIINGIFSIRNPGSQGFGCGAPAEDMMQIYEAAKWTITNLNNMNFVSGIKIGMRAFDDCMTGEVALKAATEAYPQYITSDNYCQKQTALNLGILGALTSDASIQISKFAGKFMASVVSQRAEASVLSNKNLHPSFLQTNPSVSAQATAMVKILQKLKWQKILLVYEDTVYGRSGMEEVLEAAYLENICVTHAISIPDSGTTSEYGTILQNLNTYDAKGVIFWGANINALTVIKALNTQPELGELQWMFSGVSPTTEFANVHKYFRGGLVVVSRQTIISEFETYFMSLVNTNPPDNPWYSEWYKPGYTYAQNFHVDTTVKAIYAFAVALRNAQQQLCGPTSTGVCDTLKRITPSTFHKTYLQQVDYKFTAADNMTNMIGQRIAFNGNGNPVASDFTVWNYNNVDGTFKFQDAGNFRDGVITLDTSKLRFYGNNRNTVLNPAPTSTCPVNGCSNCYLPSKELQYTYIPGDVTFLSFASSHYIGRDPLTCGTISDTGSQISLALRYALISIPATFPNILKNVNLGMLIADPCYDGLSAESFVSNLLGGRRTYQDSNKVDIDPSLIKGVIQTSTLSVIKRVTKVTGQFKLPGMGVTPASEMSNKKMYPFYTRYHPSDEAILFAIASTIQNFEWNHVQLVYKTDEYHMKQSLEFKQRAAMSSICIVAEYTFDESGPELVKKLRLLSNQTNVVVLLGWSSDVRSLLNGVRIRNAVGEFVFMGVSWAMNNLAFNGFEAEANGSIVISQDVNINSGFNQYLNSFDAKQVRADPVYSAWYESVQDCYLEAANPNNYRNPCTNGRVTSSDRYQQNLLVPFTINSVYAMARALDKTLTQICGNGYSGICTNYRSSDTGAIFHNFLQNDDFQDSSFNRFEIKNGEVLTDFIVTNYRAHQVAGEIGRFNTETKQMTSFNSQNFISPTIQSSAIHSSCPGPCIQCQYVYQHQPFIYQPGDFLIGGLFSVSNPSGNGPYQCSGIKITNGFQYTSAMLYALEQVNNGNAPVRLGAGLKVGSVAMDHCNTAIRSKGLLSSIYSGFYDSSWMRIKSMYKGLMPEKITAWLTDTSSSSHEAAEFLQPLNIPIVSPSATAITLKEVRTFYRTVQGDDATAMAILRLSKSLGFRYLQAVGSNSNYGRSGIAVLKATGIQEGVCVVASHELETNGNFSVIINSLISGASDVIVVYLHSNDMAKLLQAKLDNPRAVNLTFISPEPYSNLGSAANKMLSIKIRSSNLDGYSNYLASITTRRYMENPFFTKYYSELEHCNMPGVYVSTRDPCPDKLTSISQSLQYSQDNFVISTIDSVYAIVGALDATLKELCGDNYDSICSSYTNHANINDLIQQNLNRVNFQDPSEHEFRFQDRDGNIPYDILQHKGFSGYQKVGSYAGASIQLDQGVNAEYRDVVSKCSTTNCIECVQTGVTFTYVPGDVILGGIFDVHEKSVNPFSCGNVNTLHGFQLLEAFHYALSFINNKEGIFSDKLQGVQVGGIGLDACQSAIRTGYLVSNIHNGMVTLTKNGDFIEPKEIDAYIGAYESDNSIYLSRILNDLKIPQVSYSSSSTELKDQLRYPYFYRTIPADDNQAEAMASFLDRYNIRYVQVLYTDTSYGILGSKAFKEAAIKKRICVAQMVSYPNEGTISDEISNDVVTALLQKPVANTIIVFAGTSYINALLQAVGRVTGANSNFKFIGSETWGNSEDAILGSEKYASGSVSLNLETEDLKVFDEYLGTKSPLNSQGNPWFNEYYEEIWNCYLSVPTFQNQNKCPQLARSLITSKRYTQDPGILHVINSVFSSALALDLTLKEVCGDGYTTVCELYKNRNDRRDILLRKLDEVRFTDLSGSAFKFENREGNKGYTFYSVTRQSITSGYIYKKIGSFTADGDLNMDEYAPDWNGSCERDDACSECPTVRNRGHRYAVTGSTSANALTVVSVFDIHKMGLDEFRCGELDIAAGFQQYLAFTYTLNNFFQDLDVRGLVLDTCSNNLRVEQDLYNILANSQLCNAVYSVTPPIHAKSIGGFVVSNDDNTESAARVLNPLKYTFVSPSSTSILFNDNSRYSYLVRTIPPRSELLKVISAILRDRQWDYVSTLVSFDPNENDAFNTFRYMADSDRLCLGTPVTPSKPLDIETATAALQNQFDTSSSRVMVLFTTPEDTKIIIEAARDLGYLNKYFWVLTDTWGSRIQDIGLPTGIRFEGVAVQVRTSVVMSFQEYMINILKYEDGRPNKNSADIPREWFEEFYQRTHKCHLNDAVVPRFEFVTLCTKNEMLNDTGTNDRYILNTIAAAYATAKGIQGFMEDNCTGESLVNCVDQHSDAREEIRKHILAVKWSMSNAIKSVGRFDVSFNNEQFWNPGYSVLQFEVDSPETGVHAYTYRKVADWKDDEFQSNTMDMLANMASTCPEDEDGEKLEECKCPVVPAPAPPPPTNQQQTGTITNTSYELPEPRNFYYYSKGIKLYDWPLWAIVVAVLTCVGLLVSIIVLVYLLIAYPVRGGTTILGYMALIGIIFIYVLNFAFFFPASMETCTTRRLLMGIVYAIVFAPLLVKSVDNWLRKDSEYSAEQYHGLTSSCALLLMAIGIILVEAIIPIEWLIIVRPTASKLFNSDVHDYWWCDPVDEYDVGLVLSMIFIIFLVVLTAIFAGLAWESWRNNYESRWIFIAAVCTAGCMFVWMIVVTNAGPTVRDAAVTIGNLVNATALLFCIPLRKMIILCNYKNEKEEMNGGQNLYSNIYENPSFDPDVDYHNTYPKPESKQGSDAGF